MGKMIDLTGQRFGRLEVISPAFKDKRNQWHWSCKCGCGNTKTISGRSLVNGNTRSCGCLHSEKIRKLMTKHGFSKTRLEQVRNDMQKRCYNPKRSSYKWYGGRGITVCEEWRTNPASFYTWAIESGYEEHLTIERIDVNGNYCPENCKWVTQKEQKNNQRSNHLITYKGKTRTMAKWSEITGISYSTLRSRQRSGWSDEKTIETPILKTWSRHKQESI
jgi:hypothetical protein